MAPALMLGVDGVRRSSAELRGEFSAGDWGSGVLEAACRDRRLSGCERGFASLFACRAPRGVPGLAAGLDRCWFCILALGAHDAPRCPSCLAASSLIGWDGGERRKARYDEAMSRLPSGQRRNRVPTPKRVPSPALRRADLLFTCAFQSWIRPSITDIGILFNK
jgi:hypothetical protein